MMKKGIDMMRFAVAACLLFLSAGTVWGLHTYRDMELKRPGPKPASEDDSPPEKAFYHSSGEKSAYGPLPANEFDRLGEQKDLYEPYSPESPDTGGGTGAAR